MGYLLIITGIIIILLAVSFRYIPTDPPHIAVVTFLGRRLRKIKHEGLRIIPLYPFLFNAILINVAKKNQDLSKITVRTPDLAELEITASLTWTPFSDHAIEYLDHGGESGVRKILADAAEEGLRKWAIATEGGPENWEEAIITGQDTSAILLKIIAGLPIKISEEEQQQVIAKMRTGEGIPVSQLGIILNRFNIREIRPIGVVVKTTEVVAKEKRERDGEKIEISHIQEMAHKIRETLGVSTEQALEIIQTERGKVVKKIEEMRISVAPDTKKALMDIFEKFSDKK